MASEQNRQHSRQKPVFILVQYCTGSFRIQKLIVPPAPNTADVLRGLRDLYGGVSAHGYSLSEQIWQMVIMHRLIIGKVQVLGVLVKSSIRIYQGLTAIQVTDVEGRIVPNEHIHKISTDVVLTKLVRSISVSPPQVEFLLARLADVTHKDRPGYACAWCFYYELDKTAAIVWVSMVVLVALTVGLGVGFGAGDGKLGFDVGTGLLAVYMPIHGALLFRFS
ncbi:hypothetical protein HBI38_070290 [Parastagonospora nodorum]|nr:hypothetical protein HBH51_028820 [Parastagonospora nodorum]KAH4036640.1 hypothetical protein HBI09_075510 [Parastagonospora nodorum]KAH4900420.1 hypothetical protein HBI80_161260 [Parastagonospora nodorum]KAH4938613.1 hypothetical protein HBI79_056110 [Parastagonospora nodorum]KAH4949964.1 hypothetical protein HBH74_025740 [Parastagonospora nodorum]